MNEMPSPQPDRPRRRSKAREILGGIVDLTKTLGGMAKDGVATTLSITREKVLDNLGWFGERKPLADTKGEASPFEVGAVIGTGVAAGTAVLELLGQGLMEGDLSKYQETVQEGMYFWLWTVPPAMSVMTATLYKHGETVRDKCISVLKTSVRTSTGSAIPIWIGYTATSINQLFS